MFSSRCRTALSSAACALALTAMPAAAQSIYSVEFVPSKADTEAAVGVGVYGAAEKGLGFYFNAQYSPSERKPHYDNLTPTSFGDPVRRRYRELAMVNIGLVARFNANVALFVGGGYGAAMGKAEMYDPLLILDPSGTYYVDDVSRDKTGSNVNGGAILSFGDASIILGYHSFAKSATVGVGFRF
jgi:hypothetical protein